jgi:hypothetical protein
MKTLQVQKNIVNLPCAAVPNLQTIFWTLSIVPMFFNHRSTYGRPIEASSIDRTHQSRFT